VYISVVEQSTAYLASCSTENFQIWSKVSYFLKMDAYFGVATRIKLAKNNLLISVFVYLFTQIDGKKAYHVLPIF